MEELMDSFLKVTSRQENQLTVSSLNMPQNISNRAKMGA
jgi:hypothetical protein